MTMQPTTTLCKAKISTLRNESNKNSRHFDLPGSRDVGCSAFVATPSQTRPGREALSSLFGPSQIPIWRTRMYN